MPLTMYLTLERSCWSLWGAWLPKVVLLSCLSTITNTFLLQSYCQEKLLKQVKKMWYCTGTLKTPTDLSVSDMMPSPLLGLLPLRQVFNRTIRILFNWQYLEER